MTKLKATRSGRKLSRLSFKILTVFVKCAAQQQQQCQDSCNCLYFGSNINTYVKLFPNFTNRSGKVNLLSKIAVWNTRHTPSESPGWIYSSSFAVCHKSNWTMYLLIKQLVEITLSTQAIHLYAASVRGVSFGWLTVTVTVTVTLTVTPLTHCQSPHHSLWHHSPCLFGGCGPV